MNNVPAKLRDALAKDPEYKRCALRGYHRCDGRITWEHAIIFAGKQLQARWAIIPLCARGHGVDEYQDAGTIDKQKNHWVALNRATDEELRAISKATNYIHERKRLNEIYGEYVAPPVRKED